MTWDSVKQIITENDNKSSVEAIDILLKYCVNIINNPTEPKYRRIRLKNAIVETKLLPVVGAIECLFDMGFLEDGEFLTLPPNCSLSVLSVIKNELAQEKEFLVKNEQTASSVPIRPAPTTPVSTVRPVATTTAPVSTVRPATIATTVNNTLPNNIMVLEAQFYSKLQSSLQHVLLYEDRSLQEKARFVIPTQTLETEARQKLEHLQADGAAPSIDYQDCLLLALLNWFKTSFFSWVDAPPCDSCSGPTTGIGSVQANMEEMRWHGNRVESYRCNVCGSLTRFPRYNHPGKLLETQRGRCGEWANCFTLCCRVVGFEARYVLDWTDHVWTEVYSLAQKRWLHCDPCENVCDKPLLYEAGWGKKLSYIIAFSKDDIMDVSWRYSAKHSELLTRRRDCREEWLVNTIHKMNQTKLNSMAPARKEVMLNRIIVELVEFLTVKTADNTEHSGRTTGSLAWRLARGETGSTNTSQEYVFKLSDKEIQCKMLHVKYNCAADQYIRISSNNKITKQWNSLTYTYSSLFRKEETDWKMVYLARVEGSSSATITWKFDFTESKLKIKHLLVKCESSVYESGVISWKLCGDEQCIIKHGTELHNLTPVDLTDSSSLTITATLSQGSGDVAWQHTQLFRQSSTDKNSFPFEIKIDLI